jgi:hypothetical protein
MEWKEFLKPDERKIIFFLLMLIIAPFPYFAQSESTPSKIEVRFVWGFPPLVSSLYGYLPQSLQRVNAGIFEVMRVKTTYLWIPTYSFSLFLLSCTIDWFLERIKERYGIETYRGLLWRVFRKKLKFRAKGETEKRREKLEGMESTEEPSEEEIKEIAELIKREETFIQEQKRRLEEYVNELNTKKLKEMGLDIKENKILCSECKRWIALSREKTMKLLEKHGFEIIWKYVCPDCRQR